MRGKMCKKKGAFQRLLVFALALTTFVSVGGMQVEAACSECEHWGYEDSLCMLDGVTNLDSEPVAELTIGSDISEQYVIQLTSHRYYSFAERSQNSIVLMPVKVKKAGRVKVAMEAIEVWQNIHVSMHRYDYGLCGDQIGNAFDLDETVQNGTLMVDISTPGTYYLRFYTSTNSMEDEIQSAFFTTQCVEKTDGTGADGTGSNGSTAGTSAGTPNQPGSTGNGGTTGSQNGNSTTNKPADTAVNAPSNGTTGDASGQPAEKAPVAEVQKLKAPTGVKAVNVAATGKVKLTWKKVKGADKYKVYRATSKKGKYTLMKIIKGTSYTNTSAKAGKTYYYKVKAVSGEAGVAASSYSKIVKRTADLKRPVVTVQGAGKAKKQAKLTWKKVTGAKKYTVYRATTKNGKYKKIATTSKLSYVNKNLKSGKTYYYKVKAISKNTAANSAFSKINKYKVKK